ncbi:MAG: VWA domain-containing protein [Planctomycetota bacterium]|nr:VWA domain-containing protein [Planctomycetota bacterium]
MSFLSPIAGLLLAAAVLPPLLLLWFLKLRRARTPVSSQRLWREAIEDMRANAPFQRLRWRWLLVLQILILVLITLTIARPRVQGAGQAGQRTILMIDASGSMRAVDTDDGRSRLEHAKDVALARVDALHGGGSLFSESGETMVLSFSGDASVECRFTSSASELRKSIEAIAPTDQLTRAVPALRLARAYATNTDPESPWPVGGPAVIECISDGRIPDLADRFLEAGESLVYHRIGSEDPKNWSFSVFTADRDVRDSRQVRVLLGLVAEGEAPNGELVLRVDGAVVSKRPIRLPESGDEDELARVDMILGPFALDAGAQLEAELLLADDNPYDNVVWLQLPPPNPLRIQAIEPVPDLLRFALEALEPAVFDTVASVEDLKDGYDFTVWPGDAIGNTVLPEGRHLVFGAVPSGLGISRSDEESSPAVVMATESLHPVMRGVGVERLEILDVANWDGSRGVTELMSGPNGGLAYAAEPVGRRAVVVAFDPMESNWPALPGFVAFLSNAASWLSESLLINCLEPGDVLVMKARPFESGVLEGPFGVAEINFDSDGINQFGPLRVAGRYVLNYRSNLTYHVVNRTNLVENKLQVKDAVQLRGSRFESLDAGFVPKSLKRFLLTFVLIIFAVEWHLWRR